MGIEANNKLWISSKNGDFDQQPEEFNESKRGMDARNDHEQNGGRIHSNTWMNVKG